MPEMHRYISAGHGGRMRRPLLSIVIMALWSTRQDGITGGGRATNIPPTMWNTEIPDPARPRITGWTGLKPSRQLRASIIRLITFLRAGPRDAGTKDR